MILQIDNNKNVEKPIPEYTFSELDIKEREHIEEWIEEYPEMLGEELLIIAKEYDAFDKTNNRLDLLAIDKNGKLVIIELKRDIADRFSDLQAIHYAAYCSTFNLEQVIEIMADYTNKNKEDVEEIIIDFIDNEDFADFDNQPRIFIVSRDYQEETLAAVLWLRDNGIDVNCVKLEPYKIEDKIIVNSDILIPLPEAKNFMIQVSEKIKNTSKKNAWDEKSFMSKLESDTSLKEAEIARKIFDWSKENVDRVYWGQGVRTGSFVPIINVSGINHQLFAVLTNAKISIYFQVYSNKKPFKSEEKRKEIQKRINSINGINIPDESIKKRPTIDISVLKDKKELNKFLETFEWVINEIKHS